MLTISHLRCEYLIDPLGIDETAPRLSWNLESDRRGVRQTAYCVRVASTARLLGQNQADLWDSGRVASAASTHIAYAGQPLRSRQPCHWSVEVWDEAGNFARSAPALWSMGLLERTDWQARWIAANPKILRRDPEAIAPSLMDCGTPPLLRKEFQLPFGARIKRATLYASARGLFELYVGGQRVGRDVFAPEWTDYDKRIHYRTYDITACVAPGKNVIGALLGDGWWSGYVGWQETRARYGSLENSLVVQVEIELENGPPVTLTTDGTWRCDTGPFLFSDFMMGEIYDARRERTLWLMPGFSDAHWLPVKVVPPPAVPLVAQPSEPVRIIEMLKPVSVREIAAGTFIYDLAQNIAGWVRLKIPAGFTAPGTRIQLRYGERLTPEGTLYVENLRRAKCTDVFITRDAAEITFEPHFTFHGFQFVEISGLAQALPLENVTGCVIRSATPGAGHFECSNPDVNRLWLNGLWSQRDNFLSIPTDCPQRDERLGWMGDAQVFLRTACCNMDVAAFFTKWMIDVADAQTPDGVFPDTAPRLREGENFCGLGGLGGAAGWADAGIIVPYTLWRVYGDRRIIERHWNAMVRWLDFIDRHNPGGLRLQQLGNNYGDWLCIPSDTTFGTHSPMKNLLATAYWAHDALMMARMARELGRPAEVHRFTAMFQRVGAAFRKQYLLPDGQLSVETQTAYLLALAFDLLPQEVRARAAERLVENVRNLDWHLSTGFIGISHLNPQLTLAGHADVAYRLLLRADYPSWLYPVKHGATTIWERWNGWTQQDGFFNPSMNSFNHYSLGSVGEWLFRHVAGIELDPEEPGFGRFVLQPYPAPAESGLTFARAVYRGPHGEIASHWKRSGPDLEWSIRVPPNTAARVFIPSEPGTEVTESGLPLDQAPGIRVDSAGGSAGRYQGRYLACEAGAGTYHFRSVYRA